MVLLLGKDDDDDDNINSPSPPSGYDVDEVGAVGKGDDVADEIIVVLSSPARAEEAVKLFRWGDCTVIILNVGRSVTQWLVATKTKR